MPQQRDRYDRVAIELFRDKYRLGDESVRFTRAELLVCAARVGVDIKNPGDFPYYYGKRHALPDSIRREGFAGVAVVGRSRYAFVRSDAIEVPGGLTEVEVRLSLPSKVRRYITDDEQGMLVKVREADVLSDSLGEKVFHLQSHLRTESKDFGQVEIDDVYVTEDTERICTVEAAEPNEKLIRSQIRRQIAGAQRRFGVKAREIVPVVIQILGPDRVAVLELNEALGVAKATIYRFKELRVQARARRAR